MAAQFHFSCPIVEEYGQFPIVVNGTTYSVMNGSLERKTLLLHPENARLWNSERRDEFGTTRAGQKLITEVLEENTDSLRQSMELNGGQTEAIWVQSRKGKSIILEGNRRGAVAAQLKWPYLRAYVLPDEMPENDVFDLINQKHVSGFLEWPSPVRSRHAYIYQVERGMSIEEIMARLQFNTKREAQRYINAYVWHLEAMKLDPRIKESDWSKFHHATLPVLEKYFGYDPNFWMDGSEPFQAGKRQPSKGGLEIHDLDQIVKETAVDKVSKCGFPWFVNLISTHRVTDCRHSDGVIGPAIKDAGKPHGERVFQLLQAKPRKKTADTDHADGEGRLDSETPAQVAWNYLKNARQDGFLGRKVDSLTAELREILDSRLQLKEYQGMDETEGKLLESQLSMLVHQIGLFQKRVWSSNAA